MGRVPGKGAALLDPKTNKVLKCYDGGRNHPIPCSYVTAIAELADGTVLGGTYGGGIVCLEKGAETWKKLPVAELHDSAFPGEEKIVSLQKIKQGLESCKAVEKSSQSCVYQGEDWSTLGNWCERYGQSYAYLCAINSPSDVVYNPGVFISVRGAMGYHRYPKDSLRRWCHWAGVPEKKNVLFVRKFVIGLKRNGMIMERFILLLLMGLIFGPKLFCRKEGFWCPCIFTIPMGIKRRRLKEIF